ncbi:MAG: Na+/H+ antiporter subunit E [Burkholderiaceae bacterium]|nr:Na+/H+ antiporter subunit E [Burkholderiaceae bacterium]
MNRWLPAPWLSLAIFGGWLLLNESLQPADLLVAVLLALAMPLLMAPLRPAPRPLRRPARLLGLILRVGRDVLVSALQVARGVLRAGRRPPRGGFVRVPLQLRDSHGLAALAIITAVVPGTVWAELAPDHSLLLLHVFDLDDEARFIADFKRDYEQPLLEIFG